MCIRDRDEPAQKRFATLMEANCLQPCAQCHYDFKGVYDPSKHLPRDPNVAMELVQEYLEPSPLKKRKAQYLEDLHQISVKPILNVSFDAPLGFNNNMYTLVAADLLHVCCGGI